MFLVLGIFNFLSSLHFEFLEVLMLLILSLLVSTKFCRFRKRSLDFECICLISDAKLSEGRDTCGWSFWNWLVWRWVFEMKVIWGYELVWGDHWVDFSLPFFYYNFRFAEQVNPKILLFTFNILLSKLNEVLNL